MAAFDPIEFFGIGLGQDIAIVRRAKTRSQSSISMSSAGSRLHTSLDKGPSKWAYHAPIQQTAPPRPPHSPSHSFVNVTPEDSVRGLIFGLTTSPAAFPDVSDDSSWIFPENQPSSLERYIHTHERHEKIALSLSLAPKGCQGGLMEDLADNAYYSLDDLPDPKRPCSRGLSPNSDNPMRRYLADRQPHECLALVLEGHRQRQSQTRIKSDQGSLESSISISRDYGANGNHDVNAIDPVVKAAYLHDREQRKTSMSQLRLFKVTMLRKRPSESPQQGPKDKMAKLS